MIHRLRLWTAIALAACGVAGHAWAEPAEDDVKAAVAFNILKFVRWPPGVLVSGQNPVLCAAEPGTAKLLARFSGTPINEGSLVIRQLNRRLDGLEECHAVYIAKPDPYIVLRVSAATAGKPILLIADGSKALEQGAGMALSSAGNHVVIDVDLASSNASGLVVSSKLLRLARTVIKP